MREWEHRAVGQECPGSSALAQRWVAVLWRGQELPWPLRPFGGGRQGPAVDKVAKRGVILPSGQLVPSGASRPGPSSFTSVGHYPVG